MYQRRRHSRHYEGIPQDGGSSFTLAKTAPEAVAEVVLRLCRSSQYSSPIKIQLEAQKATSRHDEYISAQISRIMHHADFQRIEGTWRGLWHLIDFQGAEDRAVIVRALDLRKDEIERDLRRHDETAQSHLFRKIHDEELGTAGGNPFSAIVGDYEFNADAPDVATLSRLSEIASAALCPFIAGISAQFLQVPEFSGLGRFKRSIKTALESPRHAQWRAFRSQSESQFVALTVPRSLARAPYGANNEAKCQFEFKEVSIAPIDDRLPSSDLCWMNSAFVLSRKMVESFLETGMSDRICGVERGGKVETLAIHRIDDGDGERTVLTDAALLEDEEEILSESGLVPLTHDGRSNYAVFHRSKTTHQPQHPHENSAHRVADELPSLMVISRFAQRIITLGRDFVGASTNHREVQDRINDWLQNYVSADSSPSAETRRRFPLRKAKVLVHEDIRTPGRYGLTVTIEPWAHSRAKRATFQTRTTFTHRAE